MKRFPIFLLVFSALLWSCAATQNNDINIINYSDTISIEHSGNEKMPIYDGFEYGRIKGVQYEEHIESNLIQQCNSYNSALLMGDLVSCKKYMYPGVYSYYKQFYPSMSNDEMYNEFLRTLSDDYASTLQILSQQGINFEIVVPRLLNKISYNDYLFIVFEISSNVRRNLLKIAWS